MKVKKKKLRHTVPPSTETVEVVDSEDIRVEEVTDTVVTKAKSVDVELLLEQIDFQPEDVVKAAASNPVLFVKACQYRLHCMTKRTSAEVNYKRVSAELELEIRNDAFAKDLKITESGVKAQLQLKQPYKEATKRLQEAEVFDEYSKLVVECFRMRRDSLRIVSEMTRSEMSVGRAVDSQIDEMAAIREQARKRFPEFDE